MLDPEAIRAVLRRYSIRNHWAATRDARRSGLAGVTLYAVFSGGEQVSSAMSHGDATTCREDRIIADIGSLLDPGCKP